MSRSYQDSEDVTERQVCALLSGVFGGLFILTMHDGSNIMTFLLMLGTIRFIMGAFF